MPRPAHPLPRRQALAAALLLPLAGRAAADPGGRTWRIGPGQALATMAQALRQAADGDTIEVLPGTYRGDVAVIPQRRLTIVGLGAQPLFAADGRHAEGKAIWVVHDGDIQIHNIGFSGARVPDGNGAGIRFQRGRLRLTQCRFSDNQMGLLTSNDGEAELDIAGCVFSDAPSNPGTLPHLLYVGRIARLGLRNSLLQHGREGHLLKCRARQAWLSGNRFDDGPDGEASYEIDLPNGGLAWVEGNTLVQSAHSRNDTLLSYGAEGAAWPQSRLVLRRNTFINHRGGGLFVQVWDQRLPPGTPVQSSGNRLLGAGDWRLGPQGQSSDDQRGPLPAAPAR